MDALFAKLADKIDKSSKETQKDIQFLMAAVDEGKKERIAIAERLLSSTSVNRSTGLRPELAQNITTFIYKNHVIILKSKWSFLLYFYCELSG